MDVLHRRIYLRAAVLVVLFLLHGGLVLAFLRENPAYREGRASPEVPTILFFIDSRPRLSPPPETSRITHRSARDFPHRVRSDAAVSSLDSTAPSENEGTAASPPVDWLAEAHRSVSEIAGLGDPGRAALGGVQAPSA